MSSAEASLTQKGLTFVLFGTCLVGFQALFIALSYLMVYNDDPETCFYLPGLDAPATKEQDLIAIAKALGKHVDDTEPIVNMGRIFRLWTFWGFWTCLVPFMLMVLLTAIFAARKQTQISTVAKWATFSIVYVIFGAWLVLGGIWRFSRPGKVASGDYMQAKYRSDDVKIKEAQRLYGYQTFSGSFMYELYTLYLPIFATVTVISSLLLCILADSSSDDDSERDEYGVERNSKAY